MHLDTTFPPPDGLALMLRAADRLDRRTLGEAIDALIARLDAEDGDVDLEPEPDRCDAGEDMIAAGPVVDRGHWLDGNRSRFWQENRAGDEGDDEPPLQAPTWSLAPIDYTGEHA